MDKMKAVLQKQKRDPSMDEWHPEDPKMKDSAKAAINPENKVKRWGYLSGKDLRIFQGHVDNDAVDARAEGRELLRDDPAAQAGLPVSRNPRGRRVQGAIAGPVRPERLPPSEVSPPPSPSIPSFPVTRHSPSVS